MAGAGMNNIKARIKSVTGTMQITGAMELVATSKLRRAKEKVERTRPFYTVLGEAIDSVMALAMEFENPYVTAREVKKTLFISVGGDRGLAGGYNANVFKLTKKLAEGGEAVILPIGKKSFEHFRQRGYELLTSEAIEVSEFGVGDAINFASDIVDGYVRGDYDRVVLIYTKFVSMLTQTPVYEVLLPLERDVKPTGGLEYDCDPEQMLNEIVPDYIGGVLYSAVCESEASETGARRTAMNAANKNAKEMIDDLMLRYNRARQAIITQEITEIVSGAEALG